ncbi:hypothetical protein GWN42_02215, partial [candidate division KSB1 bacterium]|nr:hypothetical protein [candidate division KSB1 bacterium]
MSRRKTPLDNEYIESHMCDLGLRLYILGRLPFFEGLPESSMGEINTMFTERGYAADGIIYF